MRFVIITGMSGAGKTQVMHFMEDMGYYCIDNMPLVFLVPFAKMCYAEKTFENVAVVMDIRGGEALKKIGDALSQLESEGFPYEILFLEATPSVLVKRYKETRRKHPLSPQGNTETGIELERVLLSDMREKATHILDTSRLLTRELKQIVAQIFGDDDKNGYFGIQVESFGFKYGIPIDADLVFDVRFLPNPFYIENLRQHNGTEAPVRDFVMKYEQTGLFLKKLSEMLEMLIPHYIQEGKSELVIAVGCTGGKHRSVAIAQAVADDLSKKNYSATVRHRDIAEG